MVATPLERRRERPLFWWAAGCLPYLLCARLLHADRNPRRRRAHSARARSSGRSTRPHCSIQDRNLRREAGLKAICASPTAIFIATRRPGRMRLASRVYLELSCLLPHRKIEGMQEARSGVFNGRGFRTIACARLH